MAKRKSSSTASNDAAKELRQATAILTSKQCGAIANNMTPKILDRAHARGALALLMKSGKQLLDDVNDDEFAAAFADMAIGVCAEHNRAVEYAALLGESARRLTLALSASGRLA